MNLINREYYNTFHYKFAIVIYFKKVYESRIYERERRQKGELLKRGRRTTASPSPNV